MKAIYKRELKSYLQGPLGYVFMAFLVLIVGLYFTIYVLNGRYPWFGSMLSSTTFIFLILVPILTMRVMSEERRQKTDQLLFTAPVKILDVILGKYLAMLTILVMPTALFCCFPLLMMQFGKNVASLPMDYLAILGFFLLGAANLAIGMFLSTLTESPMLAAVLTFATLIICYFSQSILGLIPGDANTSLIAFTLLIVVLGIVLYVMIKDVLLAGLVAVVAEAVLVAIYFVKNAWLQNGVTHVFSLLDISGRLNNFIDGIMDLSAVVYYCSIVVLCLFLSVQAVQKRRWS